ncbi:transglycosylase SLT domain-containing protein [Streptococcus sciuri]|uniref:transglycosylase SLT domain-containing protein n=1 Tax=Streptococcus sciuri TaxID=2973939 RepID=UPI00278C2796|nr:transglycosylase SLT domain-containing protein [Streptococcus sciuri]
MTRLKRRYEKRRQARVRRMTYLLLGALVIIASVSVFFFTLAATKVSTETLSAKISSSKANKVIKAKTASSSSQVGTLTQLSVSSASSTNEELQDNTSEENEMTEVSAQPQITQESTEQVYIDTTNNSPLQTDSVQVTTASATYLSNGNTAGNVGSDAAAQMAAATGVPQSTWENIIARESNGNPNVTNSSGASGLFQTMPGWGSTATVQDQINAAIRAYNAQGLSAWGY